MRRRDVIVALAVSAMTPARLQAQQAGRVYRLTMVYTFFSIDEALEDETTKGSPSWEFYGELSKLGFVKGANLAVERHSAEGHIQRLDEIARSVVASKPDVIFTDSNASVLAFKVATTDIPIIGGTADPVAYGIVSNLARPGGNITGVSGDAGLEVTGKYFDLLKDVAPRASKIGLLASRTAWEQPWGAAMEESARRAQISLIGPPLHDPVQEAECRPVIAAMAQDGAGALVVSLGRVPDSEYRSVIEIIGAARLPALFLSRQAVSVGGLMAYAPDVVDGVRHLASEIGQVLRGTNPGDIPYYQARKFELIINLETAKTLAIDIPPSLLARADEVME